MKSITQTGSPPELQELVDQIGNFIEYWGFKKVHGRIWAQLFLSDQPLDASALCKKLSISKALVSLSLKDLVDYRVIREAGKSENRTTLYEAHPNVTEAIHNVLRSREKRMIAYCLAACGNLKELGAERLKRDRISYRRVQTLNDMIQISQGFLEALLTLSSWESALLAQFNLDSPQKR